jgi:hypothetical protein
MAIVMAVGFHQAEPLEELRRYGDVREWVRDPQLRGRGFVAKGLSAAHFLKALEILPRCPSVNRLHVPQMPARPEILVRVTRIDHIIALEMQRTAVTDQDLAALAGMKNLRFLDVSHNPNVNDAGVAALAGLDNLLRLDLTATNVTGQGFKDRADMVSLDHLTLTDCPVTDESLAAIPRYPKLTQLFLENTAVTDAGLMGLIGWHSLRRVVPSKRDPQTNASAEAFNEAFIAARRKAREGGAAIGEGDTAPIFMGNWPPGRR